jgi:hypothetical protein
MDLGGVVNRHFQQTKNDMYQNSGYYDSRNNKHILILYITAEYMEPEFVADGKFWKTFSGNSVESGQLVEPLIIDTHSDIYLDNFTTIGCKSSTDGDTLNTMAFILHIDQFHTKTSSNISNYNDNIVIPNEDNHSGESITHKVHKGRKINYVCSINPQKLTKLSGSLTFLNGDGIFEASEVGDDTRCGFIAEFVIIKRN